MFAVFIVYIFSLAFRLLMATLNLVAQLLLVPYWIDAALIVLDLFIIDNGIVGETLMPSLTSIAIATDTPLVMWFLIIMVVGAIVVRKLLMLSKAEEIVVGVLCSVVFGRFVYLCLSGSFDSNLQPQSPTFPTSFFWSGVLGIGLGILMLMLHYRYLAEKYGPENVIPKNWIKALKHHKQS